LIGDRYKIESTLGEGGMAVVYKARDIVTEKDVAIKMIKDDAMKNPVNLTRFDREARATASLSHPNIVNVLNVGVYGNRPYIVNEYIHGRNLRQVLDQRGRLSPQEALDSINQLCTAVLYAHRHGIIHRDIKPQNIYITADGTIKLGDFGIATFMNASHITRSETVVGSVQYMAPEISQGEQGSPQSDIYAIGITLFELITGFVPYDADNPVKVALMHINQKFPNIKKFNSDCPNSICQIIYKCCKKSPLDRYRTIFDLKEDIQKAMTNPETSENKKGFFKKLKDFFYRNKLKKRRKHGE